MERNNHGGKRYTGGNQGYSRQEDEFEVAGGAPKRNNYQGGGNQGYQGNKDRFGGGGNYQQNSKYSGGYDNQRDSRQGGYNKDRDSYKGGGGQQPARNYNDRGGESRGYGGGYQGKNDRGGYQGNRNQGNRDSGYQKPSYGNNNRHENYDRQEKYGGDHGKDDFQTKGKRYGGGQGAESQKSFGGYKKPPQRDYADKQDSRMEMRTPMDRKMSEAMIPNSGSTAISSAPDYKQQKDADLSMTEARVSGDFSDGIKEEAIDRPMTPAYEHEQIKTEFVAPKELTPGKPMSSHSSSHSLSQSSPKEKAMVPFSHKPVANHALSLKSHPKGSRTVNVTSNQFRLKLSGSLQVCQYSMEIEPMELWDPHRVQAIIKSKRREMEACLGPFVVSGKAIWTLTEIDKSMNWRSIFRGEAHTIMIDKNSMIKVNMAETAKVPESQTAMGQILNIIINNAFRDTNLKQVGRAARFFDVQNPIVIQQAELQVWSGFKAAAIQSKLGTMLCIDSIFKFMSTKSCLSQIDDMKRGAKNSHHWETMVKTTFAGHSIIANWGNKRTYIVTDIEFASNPLTMTFEYKGKETCVAEYFATCYNMHVTNPKQPLFLIKNQDRNFYLPPEFCLIDGVPDEIRKGRGMRDALAQTRITPEQKVQKIQKMCAELFKQQRIRDWGLELEMDPVKLRTNVLCAPKIWKQDQVINCDEQTLRRLPVQHPVHLKEEEWILVYGARQYDSANKVFETFQMACRQLGMKVEQPEWIELDREENVEDLEYYLNQYMFSGGKFRHPSMVVVILFRENLYGKYKLIFDKFRMPSQVITNRNARAFNASKASNILRQVNSKMRGDLFEMKFPAVMDKISTMLIGIDVCHSGRQSVVGFAASTNQPMSQYYSDYLLVPKGTEIIDNKMKDLIRKAIACFEKSNKGKKPTNFIVYRDGVGDSMREQVLAREIPQLREAIKELYNKATTTPEITVVIVNKRITQRFFLEDERGRLSNPPSGTILDSQLVEQDGETNEASGGAAGIFDFYLTPANTTQGCVLPTHFYVAQNQSCLSKLDIEHLTFALCHFYFNWAGPIKVPAPCQYAHKIADFYTTVGLDTHNRQRSGKADMDPECKRAMEKVQQHVMPLNEKLHFL